MTPAATATAIVVPLVLWRIYRRVRRMIGRQESVLWRHWSAVVFMPLLLAGAGWLALPYSQALAGWAAGVTGGALLAAWSLRLTRFENTAEGWFYTPNTQIGLALSALLVARIAYRAVVLYEGGGLPVGPQALSDVHPGMHPGAHPHVAIVHMIVTNPITLGIISLRVGYAAAFAFGLLRWRLAHAKPPHAVRPPAPQSSLPSAPEISAESTATTTASAAARKTQNT